MIYPWLFLALLQFQFLISQEEDPENLIEQGHYLVQLGSCYNCHRGGYQGSMSGGVALETDFGTFYTPNITPDEITGIGKWTFDNFVNAMRKGKSPTGQYYYPSFPFRSFTKISNKDLERIYLYLMSQPPVRRMNTPHQLLFPYDYRILNKAWQNLFFHEIGENPLTRIRVGEGPFIGNPLQSEVWNRGAYLVEAVIHCTECHTPRNFLGALRKDQWMGGSSESIAGLVAPNITPSPQGTTIWTFEDWDLFLKTGFKPDGTSVKGEMAFVIQNTSTLTPEDSAAVIDYIMTLPPITTEIQ